MITENIKTTQEIFQLVETGVVHGYDAFRYGVELGEDILRRSCALRRTA